MDEKSSYRKHLLTAFGQLRALLSAGDPKSEEEKSAIRLTFDMLQSSISMARMEVSK